MSTTDQPLIITSVDVPGGAVLGLTHCPGRSGGAYGRRCLQGDLACVGQFRADLVISLVEEHEFAKLGVPSLSVDIQAFNFRWQHVPIPDFGTPSDATWEAWDEIRCDVRRIVGTRGRLLLHCAAGLGRTGMIAAKLLVECGLTPEAAISRLRRLRPGTIETTEQVAFVSSDRRLL